MTVYTVVPQCPQGIGPGPLRGYPNPQMLKSLCAGKQKIHVTCLIAASHFIAVVWK